MTEPKYLTTQEVADLLGKPKRTILSAVGRHDSLEPKRFGQLYQWTPEDVARLRAYFAGAKVGRPKAQ